MVEKRTPLDFHKNCIEKILYFDTIKYREGVLQIPKYFGNEVLKVLTLEFQFLRKRNGGHCAKYFQYIVIR